MMIERLNGINPLDNVKGSQKAAPVSRGFSTEDSISISDEALEMAEMLKMDAIAKETPDVRADLVAQVKAKIADPNYLNAAVIESTADKILDSFGL